MGSQLRGVIASGSQKTVCADVIPHLLSCYRFPCILNECLFCLTTKPMELARKHSLKDIFILDICSLNRYHLVCSAGSFLHPKDIPSFMRREGKGSLSSISVRHLVDGVYGIDFGQPQTYLPPSYTVRKKGDIFLLSWATVFLPQCAGMSAHHSREILLE